MSIVLPISLPPTFDDIAQQTLKSAQLYKIDLLDLVWSRPALRALLLHEPSLAERFATNLLVNVLGYLGEVDLPVSVSSSSLGTEPAYHGNLDHLYTFIGRVFSEMSPDCVLHELLHSMQWLESLGKLLYSPDAEEREHVEQTLAGIVATWMGRRPPWESDGTANPLEVIDEIIRSYGSSIQFGQDDEVTIRPASNICMLWYRLRRLASDPTHVKFLRHTLLTSLFPLINAIGYPAYAKDLNFVISEELLVAVDEPVYFDQLGRVLINVSLDPMDNGEALIQIRFLLQLFRNSLIPREHQGILFTKIFQHAQVLFSYRSVATLLRTITQPEFMGLFVPPTSIYRDYPDAMAILHVIVEQVGRWFLRIQGTDTAGLTQLLRAAIMKLFTYPIVERLAREDRVIADLMSTVYGLFNEENDPEGKQLLSEADE